MPFRPIAIHRKNIKGVIYPLTAAIAHLYGIRNDGAYPLGAFYTINIDNQLWSHSEGIWYKPVDIDVIKARDIKGEDIERFVNGVITGEDTLLRSGKRVTWEAIPLTESLQLPVASTEPPSYFSY